jgi:hypothetical protein
VIFFCCSGFCRRVTSFDRSRNSADITAMM